MKNTFQTHRTTIPAWAPRIAALALAIMALPSPPAHAAASHPGPSPQPVPTASPEPSPAHAEPSTPPTPSESQQSDEDPAIMAREQALSELYTANVENLTQLDQLCAAARAAGAAEPVILIARIHHANQNYRPEWVEDIDRAQAIIEEAYQRNDPAIPLPSKRDAIAVVYLYRTITARFRGDEQALKRYAMETIWTNPDFGEVIINEIETYQTDLWKRTLRVPMDRPLERFHGQPTTLASLFSPETKALYLTFWASWCSSCVGAHPELARRVDALQPQGLAFATVNVEEIPREPQRILKVIEKANISIPWLHEKGNDWLSDLLRLEQIPWVVLLDREGRLLFHGSPFDPDEINKALEPLGLQIPEIPTESEENQSEESEQS